MSKVYRIAVAHFFSVIFLGWIAGVYWNNYSDGDNIPLGYVYDTVAWILAPTVRIVILFTDNLPITVAFLLLVMSSLIYGYTITWIQRKQRLIKSENLS